MNITVTSSGIYVHGLMGATKISNNLHGLNSSEAFRLNGEDGIFSGSIEDSRLVAVLREIMKNPEDPNPNSVGQCSIEEE